MAKKLLFGLGAIICAMFAVSCEGSAPVYPADGNPVGGKITIDTEMVEVPEEGQSVEITVSVPGGAEATTRVESTAKTWVSVEALGNNVFTVKVEMNDDLKERSAKVFFSSAGCTSASLVIVQAAAGGEKHLSVSQTAVNVEHGGASFNLEVEAYPAPTVEISEGADWLTAGGNKGKIYNFKVAAWETSEKGSVRTATIKFSAAKSADVIVTVSQSSSEYYRRSLVTKVTGSWCGYCPFMSFAIEDAMAKLGDRMVPMYIYNNSGDLTTDAETQFSKTMPVGGYPTGFVDYRGVVSNATTTSATQSVIEQLVAESDASYPSATGFDASCSVSGGKLNVEVTVYSTITEPDMKLAVAVMEDGLISNQSFYGNASDYPGVSFANYVNDNVVRTWPTTFLGESVPVEAGKTVTKSYNVTMKSSWNAANMSVAIYTIRPFPANPVQGVKTKYTDKAGGYVDNAVRVDAGKSVKVQYK